MLATLLLSACGGAGSVAAWPGAAVPESSPAPLQPASLPDQGPAPELTNEVWLNTEAPLRLADLRGRVVLLEMWTFGCINCQRVVPYVQSWHEQYADRGLVVIGDHYPEFPYEKDLANLRAAIERMGITYAVAQDNEGRTWRAYENRYWPTLYLIDTGGRIRYQHIGEGAYRETEGAILTLLAEEG